MKSGDNSEYIRSRWNELTAKFTEDRLLSEKCLQEIIYAYSQAKRYYHTLTHIEHMLRLSDEYAHSLLDKAVVDFAIFYHDYIYKVPGWGKNEEKSAAWAVKRMTKLDVPPPKVELVKLFIETTRDHQLVDVGNKDDLRYFLDFDMAILAADWEEYVMYFQNVRKEYSLYPDRFYYPGRADFLMQTLASKKIFHTEIFRATMEEKARRNMTKELKHEIKR